MEGLGTFYYTEKEAKRQSKKNRDILGNIKKTTYNGYEKCGNKRRL